MKHDVVTIVYFLSEISLSDWQVATKQPCSHDDADERYDAGADGNVESVVAPFTSEIKQFSLAV